MSTDSRRAARLYVTPQQPRVAEVPGHPAKTITDRIVFFLLSTSTECHTSEEVKSGRKKKRKIIRRRRRAAGPEEEIRSG